MTHTDHAFANETLSHDANGNETGTGFTTSTGNEQTASPCYSYTYDDYRNRITSTNTSTGDAWTYSYDFAGQMTGAVETNSDDTVISQTTYTYDALGNRIGMDENGTQTWTLYDGSDPIMDFNGSGSLEMRYLNGPTGDLVDTVIARETPAARSPGICLIDWARSAISSTIPDRSSIMSITVRLARCLTSPTRQMATG